MERLKEEIREKDEEIKILKEEKYVDDVKIQRKIITFSKD
jgi:SMC interacting uncharacterized protein involved in chromosome segregation